MKQSKVVPLGEFQTNSFGDHYLYLLNENIFDNVGSAALFSPLYGHLREPNSLYIFAGTDSGLLPKWIKGLGIPEGTRYLFVELPEVIKYIDTAAISSEPAFDVCTIEQVKEYLNSSSTQAYAYHDRIYLNSSQAVQHAKYSNYFSFWRQLSDLFEHFSWEMKNAFSLHFHTNYHLQNLAENQISTCLLRDSFKGKTAVLLAGGPSLDNYIEWIKRNREKVVVAAVSRVCRNLVAENITPDIIVSVDPSHYNLIVSKDIFAFEDNALLVNGHFLNPDLLSQWRGRKAHMGPRFPWKSEQEKDILDINGPTVTNITYGLLIEMGFQQIILLGADFCFSPEGYTHAKRSGEREVGSMPMKGRYRTHTNAGSSAETTNHYLQAAEELESMAMDATRRGCKTISPSPNAMRLDNIIFKPLDDLKLGKLVEPAGETIQRYIGLTTREKREQHHAAVLTEVNIILNELTEISELAKQALHYNKKSYSNSSTSVNNQFLQKMDNIEHLIKSKHSNCNEFVQRYGIQHFAAIIRVNDKKQRTHKEAELAGDIYYRAYIKTCKELDAVVRYARARISCLMEEENEIVDLSRLMELWEQTNQSNRAAHWKEEHMQRFQTASKHEKKQFENIEQHYRQALADMEFHLKHGTHIMASLDGVQAKALQCLLHRDIDGLHLIHEALKTHKQKDQAQQLKQLSKAYLLEISGPTDKAIKNYETMRDGPYKFDILKRLLFLYMQQKNDPASLQTLAQLAETSSTFVPLLADMLSYMNAPLEAVDLYTDYLLLTPNDLPSMFKLGKLYQQLGSLEGVEWAMNYILEKDPEFNAAKKLLAEAS